MSSFKDSDIEMTNGTFIMSVKSLSFLDSVINKSNDSEIKPDVAYGNKVIKQYTLRKIFRIHSRIGRRR